LKKIRDRFLIGALGFLLSATAWGQGGVVLLGGDDGQPQRRGAGGDIAFADTLGAVGKTLGVAVGVNQSVLDDQITQGKVVKAALSVT